ncbi:MAG: serine protease Do [Actinomycetota bacterium]|nr:serine protease Do [Actinomycetota bacterium]
MGPGDRHDEEPRDEHHEGPDEDSGDEAGGPRTPLPDPLDRMWLHPTELSMLGSAFAPSRNPLGPGSTRHRPWPWLTPLLAGAAGALLSVAVLAVSGSFDRSSSPESADATTGDGTSTRVLSAADTLTKLGPSVVAVLARDAQGTRRGSGVCVRHGKQVLTSTRVVGNAATVQIVSGDGQRHNARVVGRDRVTDLVLLDLQDVADVPAAELAEDPPPTGAPVWLVGAATPGAQSPWMSAGMTSSNDALVVSALGPTTGGLLETDAVSNTAVVGGALVDRAGSVAGIVLGHLNGSVTTYAVSITVAVLVAHQIDANGVARHGTLGIRGVDTPLGPKITAMASTAPAARAGAQVGDVVESINGRAVESITDVTALVRSIDPGISIVIELRRGNQAVTYRVELGATTG